MARVTPLREPDRATPANTEAEQALLGAILINNAAHGRVAEFLAAEHFGNAVHGRIYAAIGKLIERGQIANPVTLKNLFDEDGALAEIGGAQYLARLAEAAVTIINAEHYGRTIHDLHLRRELITIGQDVVADAFAHDLDDEVATQIERAEERIFALRSVRAEVARDLPFGAVVKRSIAETEAAYKRGGALAGLTTGLTDLDRMLGGLAAGDLVILAGRPSMGKTALALGITEAVARTGVAAGMFQLEQTAQQLAQRVLSQRSAVSAQRQRRGDLDPFHWQALTNAAAAIEHLPIIIDDTPAVSLNYIRHRARRWLRSARVGLLVIDHLQLMRSDSRESRAQEISDFTAGLKSLAKELAVPILALSQLSRAVESRDNKRPMLSDLRESGSIEQDADAVIFLYREEYYLAQSEPTRRDSESDEKFNDRYDRWRERCEVTFGMAEAIIGKQRQGPTGTVKLHWDAAATQFSDFIDADQLPEVRY